MSGACRESTAFWINPRGFGRSIRRAVLHPIRHWRFRRNWPVQPGHWSEFWGDNIGPLVCAFIGHRTYNTALYNEPPELACKRCHRWVKSGS